MATLLVGVNSSETLWQISAPIAQDTIYLKVGTEIVSVLSDFTGGTLLPTGATVPSKVRVKRPIGGTTAASHLQGATLTEYADASVFATVGPGGPVAAEDVTVNPEVLGTSDVQAALEASGVIEVVTRTLTSVEILALNTTPIELVAAVPGKIIWPVEAWAILSAGATPYIVTGDLLIYHDINIGVLSDGGLGLLGQADDFFIDLTLNVTPGTAWGEPLVSIEGLPLLLTSGGDDPTDGDGTLEVTVLYRMLDI